MLRFVLAAVLFAAPLVRAEAIDAGLAPRVEAVVPVDDGMRLGEPEIPVSEPPPELAELDLGWTLFRTMLVLAIVVALAWLTLNVGLRKLLGIKAVTGSASLVKVLERVPLDQKRSLFVVEVAGEVLLVGGADQALTLLTKLDRAEVERLRAEQNARGPIQLSPFLQKLLGRKDAPPPPSGS